MNSVSWADGAIDELSLSTSGSNDRTKNKADCEIPCETAVNINEADNAYYVNSLSYPPYMYHPPQTSTPISIPPMGPPPTLSIAPSPGRTCTDMDIQLIAASLRSMLTKDISEMIRIEIDPLVSQLNHLKTEVGQLRNENHDLKLQIDDLEQYGRRPLVRFSGISESSDVGDDMDEDTTALIINACTDAGIVISQSDTERSHRVGKKCTGKPRQIIARTTSSNFKFDLLK